MWDNSRSPGIAIIIPARNEAKNLQYVLPYIPADIREVILVDGHSTDDTIEVARQLLPSIQIVHQEGRGKGGALRQGFAASSADIIVTLDADGSADPREIPRFVHALMHGHDFAKGSRFMNGGRSFDITFFRRLGNGCLCRLVNVLFATNFTDLCYGYNVFWRHCLNYVNVDCDGFEVETLLSLRTYRSLLRIIEVPSCEYQRIWGQSNLRSIRDGSRVLMTIVREWLSKPQATVPHFQSYAQEILETQYSELVVPVMPRPVSTQWK